MVFAAVPMMLAGGIIGSVPALLLGGVSGLLLAYLDSHHLFTSLIFMTVGILFAWTARQRYRTVFYRLLRFPLFGAVFSLLMSVPIILVTQLLTQPGSISERLAAGFVIFPIDFLTLSSMIIAGGLVCTAIKFLLKHSWVSHDSLVPSPGEHQTIYRWLSLVIPSMILILVLSVFTGWKIAENRFRMELSSDLVQVADQVDDDFTLFFETGRNLILETINDATIPLDSPDQFIDYLDQKILLTSYFESFALLDSQGGVIATSPSMALEELEIIIKEVESFQQMSGPFDAPKVLGITSLGSEGHHLLGFASFISFENQQDDFVLIGQTDFTSNPFSKGVIETLDNFRVEGGAGSVVTEESVVLYHSNAQKTSDSYMIEVFTTPTFFETTQDGQVMIQYYKPLGATNLGIVVSLPELKIYQLAWESILPMVYVGLLTLFMITGLLWMIWVSIRNDVSSLRQAVNQIADGNFGVDLSQSHSIIDLDRLTESLRTMIRSLTKRFQNQTDLFTVEKESAGNPDLSSSLALMMKAALAHGVSSVRIILPESTNKNSFIEHRFGKGKHAHFYTPLDRDILTHTQLKGEIILSEFQVEKTFHLVKGMPFPASLIAQPLEWEGENLGVMYVTFQDKQSIDQEDIHFFRALAQKASQVIVHSKRFNEIKHVKDQFEGILESFSDGVLLIDENQCVVYANGATEQIFATPAQSLIGKNLNEFFEKELQSKLKQANHSELVSNEIIIGSSKVYYVIKQPIQVSKTKTEIAIFLRDVTDQKQRDKVKTEYVTTVSHELRGPLTLIQGYAKILRLTGNLNEQQNDYVKHIIDEVDEMKTLVQNLLDIGRLEADDPLEIASIDVGELVLKVVETMAAQARQKNIELRFEKPQESLVIDADPQFLNLALKNLIDNGIKFTKMGGNVSLSIQPGETDMIFIVRDTGIGVSPLDQRHLFDKFIRVVNINGEQVQGSGLGLAIVKSVAEHHGGKVWLESQLGKGSTFYLQIPNASG
jgi:PAS domain S-box-containing protein